MIIEAIIILILVLINLLFIGYSNSLRKVIIDKDMTIAKYERMLFNKISILE